MINIKITSDEGHTNAECEMKGKRRDLLDEIEATFHALHKGDSELFDLALAHFCLFSAHEESEGGDDE